MDYEGIPALLSGGLSPRVGGAWGQELKLH